MLSCREIGMGFASSYADNFFRNPKHKDMIKKIFATIALFLSISNAASAALPFDTYTISRDKLPQAAQEMLSEHFPKAKVSMIKVDRHLLKKTDYDVKLTNGTKIEFNNKGKWTSIDCNKKEVPEALVHKTVKKHVDKNYPDALITAVKKKLSGYIITIADSKSKSDAKTLKYDHLGIFKGEVTDASEADANDADAPTD